ncbi:MAG: hypothetical protein HY812_19375 [Planctomycetes bacterium]|nr:hypothetical protein [Planctomycetota bacterium]
MSNGHARLLSVLGLALAPMAWAGTWAVDERGGERPDVPSQVIFSSRPPSTCIKEIVNKGPGVVIITVTTGLGHYDERLGPGCSWSLSEAGCAEVSVRIADSGPGEDRAAGTY